MVLGELVRGLGGVARGAEIAKANLGTLRLAVASIGAVWAGDKIITGLVHMVEAGKELNKELEKTKQLGGEFAETLASTRRAAIGNSIAVPTTTPSENVRMAREIGTTIGHPAQALDVLPKAAKTAYVISHFTGESAEDITKNLARTADARGQIYTAGEDGKERVDPAKLAAEMEAAAKGLILGGGFIKSSDLLQMARQGGAAAKGQTPEAFYAAGVEAAIAMGASKLGTAETGVFHQFIGGTMTRKVAENLTTAGLLAPADWSAKKGGAIVMAPTAAQKFAPLMKDPVEYLTSGPGAEAIKSYAAKQGIDVMMAIFQLFGRQTVQRLVSEVTSNAPQFERARSIYGKIPSVDSQYNELKANDLDTNVIGFQQAWKGLMEVLGETGVPVAISVLHGLTGAIHFLTQAAANNPLSTQFLMGFVALTGAVLTLGGALGVVKLLISPLGAAFRLLAEGLVLNFGLLGRAATAVGSIFVGTATKLDASAVAMSGVGSAAWRLVAALGIVGGAVAALIGTFELLHKAGVDKPEHEGELERLNKERRAVPDHSVGTGVPNDGFGADGRALIQSPVVPDPALVHKQSYVAPSMYIPDSLIVPAVYDRAEKTAASNDRMDARVSTIADRVAAGIMAKLDGAKVMMDGRTVGQLVMDHMTSAISPASASMTGFNPRMTPMPTGGTTRL